LICHQISIYELRPEQSGFELRFNDLTIYVPSNRDTIYDLTIYDLTIYVPSNRDTIYDLTIYDLRFNDLRPEQSGFDLQSSNFFCKILNEYNKEFSGFEINMNFEILLSYRFLY
jgi:hypothetical protein